MMEKKENVFPKKHYLLIDYRNKFFLSSRFKKKQNITSRIFFRLKQTVKYKQS